jgi:hypothetical protein
MIRVFHRVIKRAHHVYTHREIDDVLEYLSQPKLLPGAIPQISRDTRIPLETLRDWQSQRSEEGDQKWFPLAQGYPMPEPSAIRMKPESPTSSE